jgi:hypothetical protein
MHYLNSHVTCLHVGNTTLPEHPEQLHAGEADPFLLLCETPKRLPAPHHDTPKAHLYRSQLKTLHYDTHGLILGAWNMPERVMDAHTQRCMCLVVPGESYKSGVTT